MRIHIPKQLITWFRGNPEAVLCQRDPGKQIVFSPVYVHIIHSTALEILLPKDTLSTLYLSKTYYRTVTLVTHKSTKSNPNDNKGLFLIASIESWEAYPFDTLLRGNKHFKAFKSMWAGRELVRVTLNPYRASYWSGIRFGSYRWRPLPKNLPRNFFPITVLPRLRTKNLLTSSQQSVLRRAHFLYIAVINRFGTIHATPVHFIAIRNRILLATSFASAKLRGFRASQIGVGFTYPTTHGRPEYAQALTLRGTTFTYGWNFLTALAFGLIFGPYLAFVAFRMYQKYPTTIQNFPFRKTPYRWQFIPLIGRTIMEICHTDDAENQTGNHLR
ncbi:MAG: hypothetical protein ACFFFG_15975 [Candidatus Thorarchaeota archaeon]